MKKAILALVSMSAISTYHYRVVFKPQTIIPDIDFRGDLQDLTQ